MGKATFRLPSEAVKYGYVEYVFDFDAENPELLGEEYRRWVEGFWEGESGGERKPKPEPHVLHPAVKAGIEAILRPVDPKPVEPTHEEAQALLVERLGASVYDEPVEEETPEWEEPPPPPSDDDWDF